MTRMKIDDAMQAATEFLQRRLKKEGAIVRTSRTLDGWEVEVEVIEPSAYLKALGVPATVQERNAYVVTLDDRLDVLSCERLGPGGEPARKLSRV